MSRLRQWLRGTLAVLALVCSLQPCATQAHESSTSYLKLSLMGNGSLKGSLDVGVFDLGWSIPLDSDSDGRVRWREVLAAQPDIASLVTRNIVVARGGLSCIFHVADVLVTRHVGEPYLSLPLTGQCPSSGLVEIRSNLFFDEDSGHRTLLEVDTPAGTATGLLAERAPKWTEPLTSGLWTTLISFVVQGLWHVWTGYDHMAFLLSLLLPCALSASARGWAPATHLRPVLADLLRIVTAFTVAHSITLALATLHLVTVTARTIEPLIAGTIVISALFNLFPRVAKLRLPLAFSFGLIHGFGFALALSELAPVRGSIIALLAGFNIGVELAQLSVVLLVAPVIVLMRHSPLYATRVMPATSLAVALAGMGWLIERLGS